MEQPADESIIRFAQCWEDADILLEALDIQPHHTCLSISSSGDNVLAMLTKSPASIIVIDPNPVQLFCLELRVAAIQALDYEATLELLGFLPSSRRMILYERCKGILSVTTREYWDSHSSYIEEGFAVIGKLEKYFIYFRKYILPLIHSPAAIRQLFVEKSSAERLDFYNNTWNNWRWQLFFKLFFSKYLLGKFGVSPELLKYGGLRVSNTLLKKTQYGLTELDPHQNPYLRWVFLGSFEQYYPVWLQKKNYTIIQKNISRLRWEHLTIEEFCNKYHEKIDKFNLSNLFEYLSVPDFIALLQSLVKVAGKNSRFAYWNLLTTRVASEVLPSDFKLLESLSTELSKKDKTFFYRRFIVEEFTG